MSDTDTRFPRVTIQFCTQCKWNLRAAYFAQELLQTFSTTLGEISLLPATGGVFKVDIYTRSSSSSTAATSTSTPTSSAVDVTVQHTSLWDRSTDGGFPETKELKRRVRDVIDPGRGLGHVDRDYTPNPKNKERSSQSQPGAQGQGQAQQAEAQQAEARQEEAQQAEAEASTTKETSSPARAGETTPDHHHQQQDDAPPPPPPGPRDIVSSHAAAAHQTHPPDPDAPQPQPHQREWGTDASDWTVPGGGGVGEGVGGTEPGTDREREEQRVAEEHVRTAPAVKDHNLEAQDRETGRGRGRGEGEGEGKDGGKRCEDCE